MFEKRNGDQTMTWAYEKICTGGRPWTALGNFMNAWYGYATDRRESLVRESIREPGQETEHTKHWAAFCAASVEFLCERYSLPCPSWVHDPRYNLAEPWYGERQDIFEKVPEESTRQRLIQTTPVQFSRRNIFSGDRLYRNKYEMAAWIDEAESMGITEPFEMLKYAVAKENSIHGAFPNG